jgi:hypothetical protein
MRSVLARLAVLGAFAVSVSACSSGKDSSLPVAGPPNNNGGSIAQFQSGANGTALIRFVQGSPDVGTVLVCIDQTSATSANVAFKATSSFVVAATMVHVVSVYPSSVGPACGTAPAAINGTVPIAYTMFNTTLSTRTLVALGGRAGTTLGLYVWNAPAFPVSPTAPEAISYNDAPTFGPAGFGANIGTTAVTLAGASNVAAPAKASSTGATPGAGIVSPLSAIPTSFFVGKGGATVTPLTTVTVPATGQGSPTAGQVYVPDLVAIDSTNAAGVDLILITEATSGYGF